LKAIASSPRLARRRPEFGDVAVDDLRTVLAIYEAMRAGDGSHR
jgi:hypothetical protein